MSICQGDGYVKDSLEQRLSAVTKRLGILSQLGQPVLCCAIRCYIIGVHRRRCTNCHACDLGTMEGMWRDRDIKINEQNEYTCIGKGPLYLKTEFEAI